MQNPNSSPPNVRYPVRPLESGDYEWLYGLATSEEVGWRWRWGGKHPSPDSFVRYLWDAILVQYVITDVKDGRPIGLLQAYGHDIAAQHCNIAVLLDSSYHRRGRALQTVEWFFNHLFSDWALRKIYAELTESNLIQYEFGIRGLFVEEGRLVGHIPIQGHLEDQLIYAVYADEWRVHLQDQSVRRATFLGML